MYQIDEQTTKNRKSTSRFHANPKVITFDDDPIADEAVPHTARQKPQLS